MIYDKDKVPDGYEVLTDMFGIPYLQRKQTPLQQRLSRLVFFPSLIVIAAVIYFLLKV